METESYLAWPKSYVDKGFMPCYEWRHIVENEPGKELDVEVRDDITFPAVLKRIKNGGAK